MAETKLVMLILISKIYLLSSVFRLEKAVTIKNSDSKRVDIGEVGRGEGKREEKDRATKQ